MSHSKPPAASERELNGTPGKSPCDAQAWRELGLDSLVAGEPASGLWFLRNAIEIEPDHAPTWQLMGRCFEQMGEETRARRCYHLAMKQHELTTSNNPLSPAAPLSLSWRRGPTRDI